ncbi:TetR/AcrR family transcriptional regulator [Marinobacter sp. NP-4(2019)]|uniref:TetR/AcrR family transcriptional regulator n=1 Tax=Marinobacter sp. NP-4(2019) TaxID=2488665 RepID=UPI000FC3DBE4|nr:TetR/AcrR family transcriptional regulator [Marinobacter sp. NP-4(2019)]AZT83876.1 TetR/AcrR family transcriptional regulator [Marinobacter sp. NP-4(2019)]
MTHSDSPASATNGRPIASSKAKPTSRRGRPVGDREAKRAELLAAAIAVTAQEGYAGASMRKVAKHAGCTTGAVTYYFANKEEMDAAVAQSLFDRFDDLLDANRDEIDVRGLIQQWLDWTQVDETDLWLALTQLLAHARHEPAFADIVQRRYAKFRQALTSVLEKGQNQGVVRSDIAADLLADQVSAMGDGWMMLMPIEPERFRPGRGQALMDAAVTLLSPPRAPDTAT